MLKEKYLRVIKFSVGNEEYDKVYKMYNDLIHQSIKFTVIKQPKDHRILCG